MANRRGQPTTAISGARVSILYSVSISSGIVKESFFAPVMSPVLIVGKRFWNRSFSGRRKRISGNTFVGMPHLLSLRFMNTWSKTVFCMQSGFLQTK
jgi:hypothetical protein